MTKKRGKGKSAKRARAGQVGRDEEPFKDAPHSFIFQRGRVGRYVLQLIIDLRQMMEPFTAKNLKVRHSNTLKDFVNVSGLLHVTHFMVLTKTEEHLNLRVMRIPRGPTLTFRVIKYSLNKDVISSIKKPCMEAKQFNHHPLLVMNGFSGNGMHFKLMTTMFQNMFPSINVNKVNLSTIRRCVLINYNANDSTIDLRHYNIKLVPVGMSRGVKKIIKAKIPNLGRLKDISELLTGGIDLSESEAELDGDFNQILLPQNMSGRGNMQSAKSAIRLTEIGPRLCLKLIKIEEGLGEGEILYHDFIEKTPEELAKIKKQREEKKRIKAERKREQEENVKKKDELLSIHKEKSLEGMKSVNQPENMDEKVDDSDNDEEYYKKEVGVKPYPYLFPNKSLHSKRKANNTENNDDSTAILKKKREERKPGVRTIQEELIARKILKNKKLKRKIKKSNMKSAMARKSSVKKKISMKVNRNKPKAGKKMRSMKKH